MMDGIKKPALQFRIGRDNDAAVFFDQQPSTKEMRRLIGLLEAQTRSLENEEAEAERDD